MNKEEIKPIIAEMKEILNKYPDRQLEILLYVFGRDNIVKMSNELTYEQLQTENRQLKEDLKIFWIALWNNDTEMTSKQSETFDKYYDEFHKKESDVK